MPVEIKISNQKYYNQLKNDDDFLANLGVYTPNLAGTVGERIRLTFDVDINWYFYPTASNTLTVSSAGTVLTRQVGSWIKDGFSAGDTFQLGIPAIGTGTITAVSDLEINCTTSSPIPDAVYSSYEILFGTNILTALIFKFGLIGNDENFTIASKVSGNDQAYSAAGINPTPVNFTRLGNYKDWITCENGNQKVNFVSQIINWQKFHIETDILINPFYLENWKSNFENGTIPDLLAGLSTLKYVFECEFLTALSNPNTSKIARVENNLGSVAFFNENFNGFQNIYAVDSIVYEDVATGESADGLQVSGKTKATITISTTSTFNSGDNFGVSVFKCSKSSEVQDKLTTLEENFIFDNAINSEGAGSKVGVNGIIKSCVANISGGKLIVVAEFEYTTAQQLMINSNDMFGIGVLVADDLLSSGNSDKVNLLADYAEYVYSADVSDLFGVENFEIFQHPQDVSAEAGVTDVEAIIEEGLCIKFDFWLDLATDKEAFLNELKFKVLAYKDENNYFELDSYLFDIASAIISGGTQQIEIDTNRGYYLKDDDYFNKINISTGFLVGTKQYYQIFIGQKISWQDWIKNLDADTIFYDKTKENNNLNYKSCNYSGLNSYQIKFGISANVRGLNFVGVAVNTNYLTISPDLDISDYEDNVNWSVLKETFTADGSIDLLGAVRKDEDTLVKFTFTRTSAFRSGYNFWGVMRIEEAYQEGFAIYELSSKILPISNCLLKAVSGETKLKLTVNPTAKTVIAEGLIDYTKLGNEDYFLSCEIDDGVGSSGGEFMRYEDGTVMYNEDGVTPFLVE